MIITTEVLDKPRITFNANPTKYPEMSSDSTALKKRPLSPPINIVQKKARGTTSIMTYPQLGGRDATKTATASIFLCGSQNGFNNIVKLDCQPFVITATLDSSNLRIDHKSQNKKVGPNKNYDGDFMKENKHSNKGNKSKEEKTKNTPRSSTGNTKNVKLNILEIKTANSSNLQSSSKKLKKNSKIIDGDECMNDDNENSSSNRFLKFVRNNSFSRRGSNKASDNVASVTKMKPKVLGNNANTENSKLGAKGGVATKALPVSSPQRQGFKQQRSPSPLAVVSNKPANNIKKSSEINSVTIPNKFNCKGLGTAHPKPVNLNNAAVINRLKRELENAANGNDQATTSDKNKYSKVINVQLESRNNSIGKRPSISLLQNNISFINQIRSRNNSLTHGIVRTRNNSLTSFLNFRPGSRNNSITDVSNPFGRQSPKINVAANSSGRPWARKSSFALGSKDGAKRTKKRMGKTTTTQTRTFQKDGKWFEETVETSVVESKDGTRTTTKTTTKQLPGPPSSADSSKGRPSPAPSRSPSPPPQKPTAAKEQPTGGLLSRLRSKAKSPSDDDSKTLDDFDRSFGKDVMAAINEKRSKHCVRHLKTSEQLTGEASRWARHLASQDKMLHKQEKSFGENIYRLTANLPVEKNVASGQQIVDQWYSEVQKHKFGQEPTGASLESGHFCQMVWKDTKELGVGIAISNSKRNIYVVTFFTPKGNWMGEFATQVPPVGGFTGTSKLSGLANKLRRSSIGSSSDEEEDFTEGVLKSHNEYRRKHGVPPLKLTKKLNKVAEDWANIIAKRDRMEHRPNNDYGENIYAKWNSKPNHTIPGHEAVESWYSEIKDHSFGKEPKSLATGHFTQLVWRDTTDLGVGIARNKGSGKLYVVCNYEPAGNFVGQFALKVTRPQK